MHCNLDKKCSSDITEKEKELLEKILSKYDFDIEGIEKVRSVYKIFSKQGIFCLKKISNGYERAKKAFFVSQYVKDKGFNNVADYVPTSDNYLFIKYHKTTFYVTKWINGGEIDFSSISDILDATELLAKFHQNSKGFRIKKQAKINVNYEDWYKNYKTYWRDIKEVVKKAKEKDNKTKFDELYIEGIYYFEKDYILAKRLIKGKELKSTVKEIKENRFLCHDSFYYQNILRSDDELYLVDLESSAMDMPISDLGKFIRRIMPRRKYKWDFDICRRIIEKYTDVRDISINEYKYLLSIIVFPHKYWKLGKKRYIKKKSWTEEKYIRKINKLMRLNVYKNEFIYCFINFYNISI